ncbi:MAG: hypothetical protein JNM20_12310 [Rhizobiales bacterium]|nr:hypothetical protein [Hyphomicrobiales bacterium]
MAHTLPFTSAIPHAPETEGRKPSGIGAVASQIRNVLESYAAAAADARLLSLTGGGMSEGTRHQRLYQQSYRPGAWGDPL